jgi:hypothetical protein
MGGSKPQHDPQISTGDVFQRYQTPERIYMALTASTATRTTRVLLETTVAVDRTSFTVEEEVLLVVEVIRVSTGRTLDAEPTLSWHYPSRHAWWDRCRP